MTRASQVSALKKLWLGLLALPKAFWGYYIAGGIAVFIALSLAGGLLIYVTSTALPVLRPIVYLVGCFIIWAYWIVASVGVWRSANVAKVGSLRIVAKIVVGLFAAIELLVMIDGGARNFGAIIMKGFSS